MPRKLSQFSANVQLNVNAALEHRARLVYDRLQLRGVPESVRQEVCGLICGHTGSGSTCVICDTALPLPLPPAQ